MAYGCWCVALVLLLAAGSNAWLFSSRRTTASQTEAVDADCIALARQGSCDFYQCFERRLPCGRDWYMLRVGQYYCNKMQRMRGTFTPAGQQFLDDSQRCLTTSLIDAYQSDMVDCHDLRHQAIGQISNCYVDNAFCNIIGDNVQQFVEMYEPTDLISRGAGSIWREIVQMASHCGPNIVRQMASASGQTISSTLQNAWSSFTGLFQNN